MTYQNQRKTTQTHPKEEIGDISDSDKIPLAVLLSGTSIPKNKFNQRDDDFLRLSTPVTTIDDVEDLKSPITCLSKYLKEGSFVEIVYCVNIRGIVENREQFDVDRNEMNFF